MGSVVYPLSLGTTPWRVPSCCAGASSRARTARCPPMRGCAAGWLHGEKPNTCNASGRRRERDSVAIPLLALAALGVALIGFGWIKGASHVQALLDAAIQQQTLQAEPPPSASGRRKPPSRSSPSTSTASTSSARRAKPSSRMFPSRSPFKPMLLALSTVALCACTTLPPPVNCPSTPEMLMRSPPALRSLPSPEPSPPTTKPATRQPSN